MLDLAFETPGNLEYVALQGGVHGARFGAMADTSCSRVALRSRTVASI